jgi:CTP synthase
MVKAANYARTNEIPYLGLCLGLQVMVIEFARHALNSTKPNSTEFDPDTPYPVIDLLPEQKSVKHKGGTMRLGNYPCQLLPDSRAARAYGQSLIYERHRHRFEFNNEFRDILNGAGLIYSGLSPDNKLVEICELANHPWMVSCQFHPEFGSRPSRPHPLFRDFLEVAKDVLREGAQPPLPLSSESED